ncbi:PD-(D/E)XK nuclease family protein [Phormidium tenue FACHB-886]|nr:PD-(D/E)XK nuclease family protein [Phormidium tenue FACHB-886]
MSDVQLLPSYRAKSVRLAGQSYFVDTEGVRLPSVTTILNTTKPAAAREALRRWRDRVGATEAQRISSTASRRGTLTHKHLQRYLLGERATCPEAAQPYWQSLEPILPQVQNVRLVEGFVFHRKLGYAGKVDCIASYKGVPCVFDWKTADKPKGSIDRLHDAPLQLAAYCGAINACYAEHEIDLHNAAVVVAVPSQTAEVFWFEPEEMAHYWQQWQARVAQFYNL